MNVENTFCHHMFFDHMLDAWHLHTGVAGNETHSLVKSASGGRNGYI